MGFFNWKAFSVLCTKGKLEKTGYASKCYQRQEDISLVSRLKTTLRVVPETSTTGPLGTLVFLPGMSCIRGST